MTSKRLDFVVVADDASRENEGDLIVDADGEMLRGRQLEAFAQRHRMPLLHIADLVEYRQALRETKPQALPAEPHARFQFHAEF